MHTELSAFDARNPVVRPLPAGALSLDNQGFGTGRLLRSWERVERIATHAMGPNETGADRYTLIDRGRARKGRGLVNEALADLRRAALLPATGYDYDLWGLELLGQLLIEQGELDEARAVVDSMEALMPGLPATAWLLGECLAAQGLPRAAYDHVSHLREFPSVFGAIVDDLTIFRTCLVRAIDSGSRSRILASLIALSQFPAVRDLYAPAVGQLLPPGVSVESFMAATTVRSPAEIRALFTAA